MTKLVFHPALVLILAALLLPFIRGKFRDTTIILAPTLALLCLWLLPEGKLWQVSWLDYSLAPLVVDKLSRLFATVFLLLAAVGGLFALQQPSRLEVPAAFVYAASAVGVILSGDLISVFLFWEFMVVGSTLVIWAANTPAAWAASRRYVVIHLAGGVILFAGICGYILSSGEVSFQSMQLDSPATWLILIGFLINAGAPPLSAWLPDAYPEASWSGTVFLSAFTTKTAIYVLLRGFPGNELLIWVGLFMIFYGIFYALLENDMRRIIAYSIINQAGFMVTGIGIGSEMALNGVAAHAFTHIIYKALLLMSAGAVLASTGKRKCSDLGGLFRSMPITTICVCIAALTTAAFPLTSGFISKSMINQAAIDGHLQTVWLLLVVASAGVILHVAIRFPWLVFFHKDSGLRPTDPPASMRWAMILLAILCIAFGIWPELIYSNLPYRIDYVPYTSAHVITQLQLILFSVLAFLLMPGFLKRSPAITLDSDWFWRKGGPDLIRKLSFIWRRGSTSIINGYTTQKHYVTNQLINQQNSGGRFIRSKSASYMSLWVMVMLVTYLVVFFFI